MPADVPYGHVIIAGQNSVQKLAPRGKGLQKYMDIWFCHTITSGLSQVMSFECFCINTVLQPEMYYTILIDICQQRTLNVQLIDRESVGIIC